MSPSRGNDEGPDKEDKCVMRTACAALPTLLSVDEAHFESPEGLSCSVPKKGGRPPPYTTSSPASQCQRRRRALAATLLFLCLVAGIAAVFRSRRQDGNSKTSGPVVAEDKIIAPAVVSKGGPSEAVEGIKIEKSGSHESASSTAKGSIPSEGLLPGGGGDARVQPAEEKGGGEEEDASWGDYIAVHGCTPDTGVQLRSLVETGSCPVITLTPGVRYVLDEEIHVRRAVVIIGRPLTLPVIDAHLIARAFSVEAKGRLDLRFVKVWRGVPMAVVDEVYLELRGGVAWIREGGEGVFTGCLMLVHDDEVGDVLLASDLRVTARLYGGFLLLEAGTLRVRDCHMLLQRPGVLLREVYTVGGYILVVSGNLFMTGSTMTANFLFVTVVGVGNFISILGGNAVITGSSFLLNAAFGVSQGIGMLVFVGGGSSILTGCVTQGNVGFLSFFGAGFGLWTGGGVSVLTGMVFNSNLCMSASAGAGLNNALGGGVMVKTGVVQAATVTHNMVAFLGVATFVGAGTVVYTDCVWTRISTMAVFFGGGGSLYLGAGVATLTNCVSAAVTCIVYVAAAGGDHAVMAGWLTMVNNYFFKYVIIAVYHGQGVDTCVTAGGALLVRVGYTGTPAIVATNPNLFNFYVAGNFFSLNSSTDVVLATRNVFIIWDAPGVGKRGMSAAGGGRRRELDDQGAAEEQDRWREEGARVEPGGPSQEQYAVTALGRTSSVIMRHVSWQENGLEDFKAAFRKGILGSEPGGEGSVEAAGTRNGVLNVGSLLRWPHYLRQLQHHRRVQVEQAAGGPLSSVDPPRAPETLAPNTGSFPPVEQGDVGPSTLSAAMLFNASFYTPLAPGSPILVPRPDPATTTTNKVYLASTLGRCQACDVRGPRMRAGGQEGEVEGDLEAPALTSAHFNGAGAAGCEFRDVCGTVQEEVERDAQEMQEQMWMSDPERGIQPNTTLGIMDFVVSYAPSLPPHPHGPSRGGTAVTAEHVQTAVNQTMQSLGLSQRLLLRVVATGNAPPYSSSNHGVGESGEAGSRSLEQAETREGGIGGGEPECTATAPFRAYLVTDHWKVANQASKRFREASTVLLLTDTIQAQVPSVCGVTTSNTFSFYVPSVNASALLAKEKDKNNFIARITGSTENAVTQYIRDDDLQSSDGFLSTEPFDFGEEGPQQPTAALLAITSQNAKEEVEDNDVEQVRVFRVVMGKSYRLILRGFPPGRLLSLRLVPKEGRSTLLGMTMSSLPTASSLPFLSASTSSQEWTWSVSRTKHEAGDYFIEVTSQTQDAFAYTQAFALLEFSTRK
ncbi:Pectin lyase fold/virulence factor [Nannochloropsis gaditana]|uniref:Pectin lyase fold/virulence factor n=1 Tax=Nannochloropsis gaditana TaxID=72520 RepID=W7TL78_9STRA|nr:Pectin lyase fold/virulence factor [Nannochloropsis gaditana]